MTLDLLQRFWPMPMDEESEECFIVVPQKDDFPPTTISEGVTECDPKLSIYDGQGRTDGGGRRDLQVVRERKNREGAYAGKAVRKCSAVAGAPVGEGIICGSPQAQCFHHVGNFVQKGILQRWNVASSSSIWGLATREGLSRGKGGGGHAASSGREWVWACLPPWGAA